MLGLERLQLAKQPLFLFEVTFQGAAGCRIPGSKLTRQRCRVPDAQRRHLAGLEGPNEQNSDGDKSRNRSGAHDPAARSVEAVHQFAQTHPLVGVGDAT